MTYTYSARCLVCEWTADGADSDRAAQRHHKKTGHAAVSSMTRDVS